MDLAEAWEQLKAYGYSPLKVGRMVRSEAHARMGQLMPSETLQEFERAGVDPSSIQFLPPSDGAASGVFAGVTPPQPNLSAGKPLPNAEQPVA